MIWINLPDEWIAFIATVILMLFHYLSPWFSKKLPDKGVGLGSFGAGVAVAYVFLHMLPNLVEYNKPIGAYLIGNQWLTPFTELLIYIVALFGFILYYGLDLMAERVGHKKNNDSPVYELHLLMFCLNNFLITYTMSLRTLTSLTATILFTFAMGLHFILTDRKYSRLYKKRFYKTGRFLLSLSLLLGWAVSVLFNPVNIVVAAFMLAFLAGSILLNVFREELPSGKLTSYFWFSSGSLTITIILLLQIWFIANA